jgi:hypothetical protein
MVSVIVVMRLFCAGIVAAQKPDPAILHGTTAKPPETVPLPAREQQSRHNQHRDTGQSYPDGFHDLRQNPPIPKPCRELFRHGLHELTRIQSVLISEICVKKHFPAGLRCLAAQISRRRSSDRPTNICRSRGDETHFKFPVADFQSETPHVVSYGAYF